MSTLLPTVIDSSGVVATSPTDLQTSLITLVSASQPSYTANLPGSLIEDISSTDVGALTLIENAKVDTINSVTPLGCNAFILTQLGAIYGVAQGIESNTSVYVTFYGTPGYIIPQGFTVSDGTYTYVAQEATTIESTGVSSSVYCVSPTSGTWAVPEGSVTTIATSVPSGYTVTCTNLTAGTPGADAQEETDYRAQVLQAGAAAAQGMPSYVKACLKAVSGVDSRLISMAQTNGNWQIIVGGGDPYAVAGAIYKSVLDINSLTGSALAITAVTNTNPIQVTMNLAYNLSSGTVIALTGVEGMTGVNNVYGELTAVSSTVFTLPIDGTSAGTYTGGGTITPNPRTETVTIIDYPNNYVIPFVIPPQQLVGVTVTWNTSNTQYNYVPNEVVSQLAIPDIISYINDLQQGYGINLLELQSIIQLAVVSVIPQQFFTRLLITITINGVTATPDSGTEVIYGDIESYFYTSTSLVTMARG